MKKMIFIIFTAILFFSLSYVKAASITETKYENGKISISGTGDGEIQVVLFGLDNSPLYLTTVTAENSTFSITLPEFIGLKEGTYNIKVSDYDGTNVSTASVKISYYDGANVSIETDTEVIEAEKNPQTLDSIILYLIIGSICLSGIITLSLYIYKVNRNSKNQITKNRS